jgi:hypothetical protein
MSSKSSNSSPNSDSSSASSSRLTSATSSESEKSKSSSESRSESEKSPQSPKLKKKQKVVEHKSKNLKKIFDAMNKIPTFAALKKIAEANDISITNLNGLELSRQQLYKKIKTLRLHLPKTKEIKDKRPKVVKIDKRLLDVDKSQIIVDRAAKKKGEKSKQLKRHEEILELNKIKQETLKIMELRKIYEAEEKSRFDFMFNLSITSDEEIIGNAVDGMLERLRQVEIDGNEEPFLRLIWEDSILFYTLLKKSDKKDISCFLNKNPLHDHSTVLLGLCLKERGNFDSESNDEINKSYISIREKLLTNADREKMEQWKSLTNHCVSEEKAIKIEKLKEVKIELEILTQVLKIKRNIEKREQVESEFDEDEEVDEDTLNNQLIELLKIASVYITDYTSDYPKHIKTMYENRDKVSTYEEMLEMYTTCLEEYTENEFHEKNKLKLTLGYEDYLSVYQQLLNQLKNKILQINGDIGVLRQYISFLHEDKDEELDKQEYEDKQVDESKKIEIEKLTDKKANYEKQLAELMTELEKQKNTDSGISTDKNVNQWLSDNVERTKLILKAVEDENKDVEAKNLGKWLVEDMAKYRLNVEKEEVEELVNARKDYLFYKNKQEQIELLLKNKLYCETKIKKLEVKVVENKKEVKTDKKKEDIQFLIEEFYNNNEEEIVEEISLLEKEKKRIKHKIDLILISQEKISIKVKQLHKKRKIDEKDDEKEEEKDEEKDDEKESISKEIKRLQTEIDKFETKKKIALTVDIAQQCHQHLLRLNRDLVIAQKKLSLNASEMSIDELTQKIDELLQEEQDIKDSIKYTDKTDEEVMIMNTIRDLEDKLSKNCLTKEDYETVKTCRDLLDVLSLPFLITGTSFVIIDDKGNINKQINGRPLVDVFDTKILEKYKDDIVKQIKDKHQLSHLLKQLDDPVLMKKKERELLALKDIKDGFVFRKYKKPEEKSKFVPKYGQKEIKIIIEFLTKEDEFLDEIRKNLDGIMETQNIGEINVLYEKTIEEFSEKDIKKFKKELSSRVQTFIKKIKKLETEYKKTEDAHETIQYAISLLLFFRDNYIEHSKKSSETSKTIEGLDNLVKQIMEKRSSVSTLMSKLNNIISAKISVITKLSKCEDDDTPEKQSIRDMIANFKTKLQSERDRNVLNTSAIKEFLRKEKDDLTEDERKAEKARLLKMLQQFNQQKKVKFVNTFFEEKLKEISIEDRIKGLKELLLTSNSQDVGVYTMIKKYKLIDVSEWKKWKDEYEEKGKMLDTEAFLNSLDFTTFREYFSEKGKELRLLIDEITKVVIEKDMEDVDTLIEKYKLISKDDMQKLKERKALFKAELENEYLPREYLSLLSKIKKYETTVEKLDAKDKAEYAKCKTEIKPLLPNAERLENEHIVRLKELEDSIKELLNFDTMRQKIMDRKDKRSPSFKLPEHNCTRQWFLKPWVKGYRGFLVHFIGLETPPDRMILSNKTVLDDEGKEYYEGSVYLDIVLCTKKSQEGSVITFNDNGEEYKVEVMYKKYLNGETVSVPNDEAMYQKEIDWKKKFDKTIEEKISEFASTRLRDMGENWEKAAAILISDELQKLFQKENAVVIQEQLIEKYRDGTVSDLLLALGNIFVFLDPKSKYFSDKTLLFRERLKNGYISESQLVDFEPKDILYELYLLPKSKIDKVVTQIDKLIQNFIKKKIYMYMIRHQLTTTQKVKYEMVGTETFATMFTKNNCVNIVDGSLHDYDIVYYKEDGILYCFSIIELLKNPTNINKYTGKPFGDSLVEFLSRLQIPTLKKREIVKVVVTEKVPSLLDDLYDDLKELEGSVRNEEYKDMFIKKEDALTMSIWKVEEKASDNDEVPNDDDDEVPNEDDDEEDQDVPNEDDDEEEDVDSDTSDDDDDEDVPDENEDVDSDTSDDDEEDVVSDTSDDDDDDVVSDTSDDDDDNDEEIPE